MTVDTGGEGAVLEVVQAQPCRPSTWIFGASGGIQVWATVGPAWLLAAVLTGEGAPIVMLNQAAVGTHLEMELLNWANQQIASGFVGFTVKMA